MRRIDSGCKVNISSVPETDLSPKWNPIKWSAECTYCFQSPCAISCDRVALDFERAQMNTADMIYWAAQGIQKYRTGKSVGWKDSAGDARAAVTAIVEAERNACPGCGIPEMNCGNPDYCCESCRALPGPL